MKKPETYNELINHHNCLEIIRRYEVTRAEIDRIYDYMNKLDHFALVADSKQIAIFNASLLVEVIPARRTSTQTATA